jgi:hypothetical protein
VDTYQCAHNGQHPYLFPFCPDGFNPTLTFFRPKLLIFPLKWVLQTALTSEKASHKADVSADAKELTAVKVEARKSKLKWFGIGFVAGFIARHSVGF